MSKAKSKPGVVRKHKQAAAWEPRPVGRLLKAESGLADEGLGDAQGTLLLIELLIGDHLGDALITLHHAALAGEFGGNFQTAIKTHGTLRFCGTGRVRSAVGQVTGRHLYISPSPTA